MRDIRTKKRKPKRFEWKKTEATCVFVVTGNTWYMRQVNCLRLGDWAYHWLYNGYYSVFHCLTCSLVGHYQEEKKARSLVKRLSALPSMPMLNKDDHHSVYSFSNWLTNLQTLSKDTIKILPDNVTYNPEEDIPF